MSATPDYFEGIVETVRQPPVGRDEKVRVKSANQFFYETLQLARRQPGGGLVYERSGGDCGIPGRRLLPEEILPDNLHLDDFEGEHLFAFLGRRVMRRNARPVALSGPKVVRPNSGLR